MSAWIEVIQPEGRRSYVKTSTIERIILPPNLASTDIARPDAPIRIMLRDAGGIDCINQTAMHLLHGILVEVAQVCPADDGKDA